MAFSIIPKRLYRICMPAWTVLLAWAALPGDEAYAQDYPATLASYETEISMKNGALITSVSYEIRINNRAGDPFTEVSIPFSKLRKLSGIEASIRDRNGNVIRKLKNSEITERHAISQGSFYEDALVKEFTLKYNAYPYTLCYSYEVKEEEFMFVEDWVPVLDTDIPTEHAVLHVELPAGYPVAFSEHMTEGFRADSGNERISYIWEASYSDILASEVYAPDLLMAIPRVVIVPLNFHYDLPGSVESWRTFGNWQYDLIRDLSDLPEAEKERIRSRVAGISDPIEKIRTLYHDLQDETRYINITIETGGLRPYPASYVAANKYGDCKALTNYFKAVLECIGIPSFYTKVYAGEPIRKVDKDFPSQQFNHIILCVPLSGDTLWLDCTSDGPFNYLGTFTQNREALLVENDNSHFVRTPALQPDDVLQCRKVVFSPASPGSTSISLAAGTASSAVKAQFTISSRGDEFTTLSYLARSFNEADRSRIIRNNFIENGFELIGYELPSPQRDSKEICLSYTASSGKFYSTYGRDVLMELLPFPVPDFERPADRKLPVQLDRPLYLVDSLTYQLPAGYEITGEMDGKNLSGAFGHYRLSFEKDNGSLRVYKEFLLHAGDYRPEEYDALYEFIEAVGEIDSGTYLVATRSD